MSEIGEMFEEAARDRLLVVGRWLFRVRRVRSDDLRRVGRAELVGASSARQAHQQAQDDSAVERVRHLGGEAQAEKKREMLGTSRARQAQVALERIMSRPEGEQAWLDRCDAYLRACVVEAGRLRAGVERQAIELLEIDQVEEVAHVLRSGRCLEPVQLVPNEGEADYKATPARVWLHVLSPTERAAAGSLLIGMHSTAGEVLPFRGRPADAPTVSPDGADVRADAPRAADADPLGGGVQRGLPGRGGEVDGGGVRGRDDGGAGPPPVKARARRRKAG